MSFHEENTGTGGEGRVVGAPAWAAPAGGTTRLERVVVGMEPGAEPPQGLDWLTEHFAPGAETILVQVYQGAADAPAAGDAGRAAAGPVVMRQGRPAEQLVLEARARDAALIVLGPQAETGGVVDTFWSTAEDVEHRCTLPVLVLKGPPHGAPRRVLLPVGVDGVGPNVARWAGDLARRFDAEITALHVEDLTEPAHEDHVAFQQAYLDEVRERMEGQLARAGLPMARVHPRVVVGEPGRGVVVAAGELEADLVVVGNHGAGMLQRLFVDSVAGRVMRAAPCPVLMVPDRRTEAASGTV